MVQAGSALISPPQPLPQPPKSENVDPESPTRNLGNSRADRDGLRWIRAHHALTPLHPYPHSQTWTTLDPWEPRLPPPPKPRNPRFSHPCTLTPAPPKPEILDPKSLARNLGNLDADRYCLCCLGSQHGLARYTLHPKPKFPTLNLANVAKLNSIVNFWKRENPLNPCNLRNPANLANPWNPWEP